MTTRIDVTIPGEPIPQPRAKARIGRTKSGMQFVQIYTPKSQRKDRSGGIQAWKQLATLKLREQCPRVPWDGPVELDVTFYFERTQELEKPKHPAGEIRHSVKPDGDNLVKAIKDVMTEVGIWKDDGRVCDTVIRKRYCARGFGPGVRVIARLVGTTEESLYA